MINDALTLFAWLHNMSTYELVSVLLTSSIWIGFTSVVYVFARLLFDRVKQNPLFNPLAISSIVICVALLTINLQVADYRAAVTPLELLLGPATVALAMPLFRHTKVLLTLGWRVVIPIAVGGTVAPLLAWFTLYQLDVPMDLQMTMLVKSITTPLAMETTALIGGIPELAAVFVILTGIVGATLGPLAFVALKIKSEYAQGLALGSVAHVMGTSKAISISEACAAFATLALCLNGVLTSILLPLLFL